MDNKQPGQASPPPNARHCPTCLTSMPTDTRRRYCTPACKTEGWRRDHAANTDRQPNPRKTPVPPPPATIRDCPHCGHPIAVVALLTTPHAARPDTPRDIR